MISYLRVKNLASIEDAEMRFEAGFTVLTGETGAGKTALVEAIGLLLGDRADSMRIRQGEKTAQLECVFDLTGCDGIKDELVESGALDSDDDELMLGRFISTDTKGKCSVNGRLCPLSVLGDIGELIVDLHGQNTHQALMKAGTHRSYLDRFAGARHLQVMDEYHEYYQKMRNLESEKGRLGGIVEDVERQAGLLEYELQQIDEADLKEGELEELEEELSRIRHGKELYELGTDIEARLATGGKFPVTAVDMIDSAVADIKRMQSLDGAVSGLVERLESTAIEIEDIKSEIVLYLEELDVDPGRQQEVEGRINKIRDLARKFGGSIESVIAYREEADRKLREIMVSRDRINEIESELGATLNVLKELGEKLTDARKKAAKKLGREVDSQLAELEMSGSSFEVSVTGEGGNEGEEGESPKKPGPYGVDKVEFMFSPQKELPAMPLRRIASGGEMSRVMLALKIVLAAADRIPVLIFDEVDTGIGGETALKVGEKLYQLTRYHQVFCVTHQPQIAAYADTQHRVLKEEDPKEAPKTRIEPLSNDGRVDEICRMLGDSSGRRVTKDHARDLLKRSGARKSQLSAAESGVHASSL